MQLPIILLLIELTLVGLFTVLDRLKTYRSWKTATRRFWRLLLLLPLWIMAAQSPSIMERPFAMATLAVLAWALICDWLIMKGIPYGLASFAFFHLGNILNYLSHRLSFPSAAEFALLGLMSTAALLLYRLFIHQGIKTHILRAAVIFYTLLIVTSSWSGFLLIDTSLPLQGWAALVCGLAGVIFLAGDFTIARHVFIRKVRHYQAWNNLLYYLPLTLYALTAWITAG